MGFRRCRKWIRSDRSYAEVRRRERRRIHGQEDDHGMAEVPRREGRWLHGRRYSRSSPEMGKQEGCITYFIFTYASLVVYTI